ncbi:MULTISPECIES: YkvS family protein [Pontibacillus]|uniref:YkvS family protein n=1 Tax=Pontibacillus chungwhensis TaxID=265426 RepID=A0ABY8UXY3_9BACI|nr:MULTISPECIES: YkvS family protein [Pontibacillus]MCD5325114.1 YkvS family protein [Pontibacillus sp. HN14]WIF97364.1 YkvS family protein [Pontibacillus chungwhensis]
MADENMSKDLINAAFEKKNAEEPVEDEKIKEEDKATEGDIITFQRDGQQLEGIVTSSKLENSVVVDMTIMDDFNERNLDFEKTVVAHTKYSIKKRRDV